MFYGITPLELRKVAYDFAEKNGMKHKFNKNKQIAGKDWFQAYLKRHPNLSIRKPEATSLGRISGFNREFVEKFFTNLNEVLLLHKFKPDRIYNVDETGISTVPTPSKIVGPKGVKQLGKSVSWERGRNITVVCAISASGNYIPPMFIFPRERMSEQLTRNGPVGAIYSCSKKGWINEDFFLDWLNHFVSLSFASKKNPVLLLLDNHCSHSTLAIFDYCRSNGVIMLSFQKITPYNVAEIFKDAYVRISTIEKAQNGFRVNRVVPYNPNIFTEEDILPATMIMEPTTTVISVIMV
ncbi:PREDICTED: jerky protein homolog-like [Diuraphis noxia]|uniref:jerky protein homolog-like n=1 Tax=Diuraphis noxia TaxID=143948 RepID=UPI0007636C0D|nr:PREDICTED: jerky protein homolog-like [Diuraphis noxia]